MHKLDMFIENLQIEMSADFRFLITNITLDWI